MASQRKKRGLTDDEKAKLKKAQRWLHEAKTGWRKDQKVEWPKHRVQIVTKVCYVFISAGTCQPRQD